jgi:tRNA1(Val) A37 N6-methylase TrmN6
MTLCGVRSSGRLASGLLRVSLSSSTRSAVDIGTGAGALLLALQRAASSAGSSASIVHRACSASPKVSILEPLALMDVQQLALPATVSRWRS